MRYLSIREEINFYHFFLLELIRYKSPVIFSLIYENRELIINSYKDLFKKSSTSPAIDFASALKTNISASIKNILEELFKKNSHIRRYSLVNELYFFRYFSLSLLETDFSTSEFEAAFNQPLSKIQSKLVEFNTINSPLLAEKLFYKFNNTSIENTETLNNTLDSLLYLYNEIFHSKNQKALAEGVNVNNLGKLIIDIIELSNRNISILENRLLKIEVGDYSAFGYLLSAENIYLLAKPKELTKLKEYFKIFRKIQLEFLKREITKVNGELNERIISQFQLLKGFASFSTGKNGIEEYTQWYFNHVIIEYKAFIKNNLNYFFNYVKKMSFNDEHFDIGRSKEIIDSIFLDISFNTKIYLDNEFEKLVDFYNGFETVKVFHYSFVNQTPPDSNYPECNDHIIEDVFELKKGIRFEISIEPLNTQYWRFGFRLSQTKEFPQISKWRHIDGYPFIHLSKGHIDIKNGDGHDDSPIPNLDLTVYSGSNHIIGYPEKIVSGYSNEKITFYLYKDDENIIYCKVRYGDHINSAEPISAFPDFMFTKISAWADRRDFTIGTKIKVLQQINPSLIY